MHSSSSLPAPVIHCEYTEISGCRHVYTQLYCPWIPFFKFPFKKDRKPKFSANVCITEVISSGGVCGQRSVLTPARACHHMPSTAFNFRTSCYSLVGVDTSRKWSEGRLIGIALKLWVLLEVLGIFFLSFWRSAVFWGALQHGTSLREFCKPSRNEQAPKSTIFSWFKRHRKLSVHCPCFLRLWPISVSPMTWGKILNFFLLHNFSIELFHPEGHAPNKH